MNINYHFRRRRSLLAGLLLSAFQLAHAQVPQAQPKVPVVAAPVIQAAPAVQIPKPVQAPVAVTPATPSPTTPSPVVVAPVPVAVPVAPAPAIPAVEQIPEKLLQSVPKASEKPSKNCWMDTAARYNLDPYLLFAVAMVESNLNPRAVNMNRDEHGQVTSADLGMMQINTENLPMLARYGITPNDLAEPCTSIRAGAWILALNIHQLGYSWQAIGAYNVGQKKGPTRDRLRADYARTVYAMYDRLRSWGEHYTVSYHKKHGHAPSYVPKPPKDWKTPKGWKSSMVSEAPKKS